MFMVPAMMVKSITGTVASTVSSSSAAAVSTTGIIGMILWMIYSKVLEGRMKQISLCNTIISHTVRPEGNKSLVLSLFDELPLFPSSEDVTNNVSNPYTIQLWGYPTPSSSPPPVSQTANWDIDQCRIVPRILGPNMIMYVNATDTSATAATTTTFDPQFCIFSDRHDDIGTTNDDICAEPPFHSNRLVSLIAREIYRPTSKRKKSTVISDPFEFFTWTKALHDADKGCQHHPHHRHQTDAEEINDDSIRDDKSAATTTTTTYKYIFRDYWNYEESLFLELHRGSIKLIKLRGQRNRPGEFTVFHNNDDNNNNNNDNNKSPTTSSTRSISLNSSSSSSICNCTLTDYYTVNAVLPMKIVWYGTLYQHNNTIVWSRTSIQKGWNCFGLNIWIDRPPLAEYYRQQHWTFQHFSVTLKKHHDSHYDNSTNMNGIDGGQQTSTNQHTKSILIFERQGIGRLVYVRDDDQ